MVVKFSDLWLLANKITTKIRGPSDLKSSALPLLGKEKNCRDPGSNQGPLDLQSNALPTELSRLVVCLPKKIIYL